MALRPRLSVGLPFSARTTLEQPVAKDKWGFDSRCDRQACQNGRQSDDLALAHLPDVSRDHEWSPHDRMHLHQADDRGPERELVVKKVRLQIDLALNEELVVEGLLNADDRIGGPAGRHRRR